MRLIDANRLKEVFRRNTGHDYSELIDIQPTVDVLNKMRSELHATAEMHDDGDYYLRDEWIDEIFDKFEGR